MSILKQIVSIRTTLEQARTQLDALHERAAAQETPDGAARPPRPPRPTFRAHGRMSVDEARALAMAYELSRLLAELNDLPENGAGSCVEFAWDLVDEAIAYLEPDEAEKPAPARRLRLAATQAQS